MLDFGYYNIDCMNGTDELMGIWVKSISRMRLYNDDCLKILKRIPDESIDLVVTDCPYHIVSGGCTNDAVKIGRYSNGELEFTKSGKLFENNDIEFKDWMPEVYRVLKQDTHCYVMINARNLKDLWLSAEKVGFNFLNLLVWDKGNVTPNRWYMGAYELILMLRKGKARKINNKGTSNILRVPNVIRNKLHPVEKPVELMRILIENSTNEGDTVIDPFMGVGSTGLACKETNRHFIGCEIDEKYYKVAKDRIEGNEEYQQLTIWDYLKGEPV